MTEAIYKVGDILEFTEVVPRQFGLWTGPVRGLVVKISDPGYEYLSYSLLLSGTIGTTKKMTLCSAFEKDIIPAAKRVGHIDISALMFMENDEPDYEKMMAAYACVESANLRKLNAELTKKLNDNAEQIYQLRKENEDFRTSNKELSESLSNSEMKAHSRLDEISFLTRKVDELENARDKLKAERDEANHEIDRLRTVVGELNNVINDLNASKSEFSDLFYSLKIILKTNDILEGVNKLKNENERLSNAQRYLDLSNENREHKAEYFACTEKIKELEDENAKYFQSMTCVEKQLNEATKRIQAAMEHLNVAFCDNVSNA